MTALVYSNTPIAHNTDAEFRAWAQELHACVVSAGWLATADTGQVDLTTALRPSASSFAGYKMYADPSSAQGVAPIFLKLQFGTASTATYPQVLVQIGSATNGAGILSGATTTQTTVFRAGAIISEAANYQTLLCYKDGYLSITFKKGATTTAGLGHFSIHRSMLANHTVLPEAIEFYTIGTSGNPYSEHIVFSPLRITIVYTAMSYIPPGQSLSSLVGIDVQTYKHYMSCPRTRCNPCKMTVNAIDVPDDTIFSQALTDSTVRTYRCLGIAAGNTVGIGAINFSHQIATLWE